MERAGKKRTVILLTGCMAVTGVLGGGYFVSVSAFIGIILLGLLLYRLLWKWEITLACDVNLAAFSLLAAGYLFSALWAVDSGMAVMGFVKFLPLLLFYIVLSGKDKEREAVVAALPALGSIMTAVSAVMMQFSTFREWVSVAGRLAGFFQYPNTYALFMLVCFLIVAYRLADRFDLMDVLYAFISAAGIYMSGSRTVFILAFPAVLWFAAAEKKRRRLLLPVLGAVLAAAGAAVIISGGSGVLKRFMDISLNSSTFLGRLLYMRDAVPVILSHPFGLGYYGYYFIQQSVQTGVYSVVNVHNELLQIMLDIGVIPAVVMAAAAIKSLLSKKVSMRNKELLAVMAAHSMLDYDFQFLVMGFLWIMLIGTGNVRTFKVPRFTGAAVAVSAAAGMSDAFYVAGKYAQSYQCYKGNTMAEIQLLATAEDAGEMEERADSILERNKYVSAAYSAKARVAFSKGDAEEFIKNKLTAIHYAPYQYEEYTDYLEMLAYCTGLYIEAGDRKSAQFCAERAAAIPDMLEEVKERTSALGWKIKDTPAVMLSHENLELIEDVRERAYEEE